MDLECAAIPTVRTSVQRSDKPKGAGAADDDESLNLSRKNFSYRTPVCLAWKDLTVSVKGGQQVVLDRVTAHAEPGRLLAIMGPSGCGKTTLLETLAGRRVQDGREKGQILVNGLPEKLVFGKTAAYVTQDDILIGTLTVFETIWFSACLRFPDDMNVVEKKKEVEAAILEMGLHDARNTRVGTWGVKGLSGGEKRRLSIALEILTRPSILFLDEPTSGLDSAAAYFVIQRLRDLAKEGHAVIAVVHQPSSEVFHLFQDLLLLSSGRIVYFGKVADAPEFFASAGYACPPLQNPSDHYLRCINKDFENVRRNGVAIEKAKRNHPRGQFFVSNNGNDEEAQALADGSFPKDKREIRDAIQELISTYRASDLAHSTAHVIDKYSQHSRSMSQNVQVQSQRPKLPKDIRASTQSGFHTQLYILTKRSFTNMRRDWSYYWIRLLMYIALAVFIGYVYFNEGLDYHSIDGRAACSSFIVGFLTFMSIGGFPSFIEDMKVFSRERKNGHYGVMAFVIANTLSALPFLLIIGVISSSIAYFMAGLHSGAAHYAYYAMVVFACLVVAESIMMAVSAVVPNFLMGIVVGASIMATFLLVAGFYRLPDELPKPVTKYPLFYENFFMYAQQGTYKNEFTGLTFSGEKPGDAPIPGTYVLGTKYQINTGRSKWVDLIILSSNIVVYRVIFFLVIKARENIRIKRPQLRRRPSIVEDQREVKM